VSEPKHEWNVRRAKAREFARALPANVQSHVAALASEAACRELGYERLDFGPKARSQVMFALEFSPSDHKALAVWDYAWEGAWVREVERREKLGA
jgi:hypothetical protein